MAAPDVSIATLVSRRADMLLGLMNARAQADGMRAQLAQVERDITATEGAVVALSTLIDEAKEASHGTSEDTRTGT
jgi:hypothetical protein